MKPSILFTGQGTGAEHVFVEARREYLPLTVFQSGLGAGETLPLELLTSDTEGSDPNATYTAVKHGGTAVALTDSDSDMTINTPGVYRITVPATAGVVVIGSY